MFFQLYSILGFMFPEDSSPAFALFKFVQVVNFMKNRFLLKTKYLIDKCEYQKIIYFINFHSQYRNVNLLNNRIGGRNYFKKTKFI